MSWLSDKEICEKVRKNGNVNIRKAFYGVFPIDKLPQSVSDLPIFLVVNTDAHNLEGQHWKTIFISKDRYGEVFDSLAQPMSDFLNRWMNRFTRRWKRNHKVYQHAKSDSCGAFALYYIFRRLEYPSLDRFTKTFSSSLYENECLVRSFYKDLK